MIISAITIESGARFGEWVVIARSHSAPEAVYWLCKCSCGREKPVAAQLLRGGRSKRCASCADDRKRGSSVNLNSNDYRKMRQVWHSMIRRCERRTESSYERYGGRGIKVAEVFKGPDGFSAFVEHLGTPPSTEHEIDRIDNDGNYEPGNIRWATHAEQVRNRSTNRFLTLNGITQCLEDWNTLTGLPVGERFRRGWPIERLLAPRYARRNDVHE